MKVELADSSIQGPLVIEPEVFHDARGYFVETYRDSRYRAAGVSCGFVQDNHSVSTKGTLRGLHFQRGPGQAKLVRVVQGRIFDVAVDMRKNSPTLGRWCAVELRAEHHKQFFVPSGFAHGFCVLSDVAVVLYKLSTEYDPSVEAGFRFDDPEIGVQWPMDSKEVLVSNRDSNAMSFRAALAEGV